MKKAIALVTIIFMVATTRAQYISIPDAAFGTWLSGNGFSACMTGNANTGWHLDTTCAAVVGATSMSMDNVQAQYLQGIQYFKNLTYLSITNLPMLSSLPALPPALTTFACNDNGELTALPALPTTLQTLSCINNGQLGSLPALPASLTYINCSQNNIGTLPALPASLVYLNCRRNNMLASLPVLPNALTYLDCSNNNISSLPGLPAELDTLICSGNMITTIPTLPGALIYLDCSGNFTLNAAMTLPALPASLIYLNCAEDKLNGIPFLPASLNTLMCYGCHLTTLPGLPAALTYLDCNNNQIIFIPPLPDSLSWFDCSYNAGLTCLPHLNAVVHLNFTNTAVTCIPDLPTSNTYTNPTVPICTGSQPCTAGINQVADEHFSVYPNPASNHLTVENSGGIKLLRLSNMLGQTVYSVTGNSQPVLQVDVSNLQAGIYIVEAYSANGVNTAKVIVGN